MNSKFVCSFCESYPIINTLCSSSEMSSMLSLFEFHIFGWSFFRLMQERLYLIFIYFKDNLPNVRHRNVRKKSTTSMNIIRRCEYSRLSVFFNVHFSVIGVCHGIERIHSAVNAYALLRILHHKHIFISYGGTSIRISVGKRNISDDWQKIDTNFKLASE